MTEPTIYAAGLPRAEQCILCNDTKGLVNDHCHTHGYLRGTVCASCNAAMARVDRGRITEEAASRAGGLDSLIAHRLRCPNCSVRPVRVEKGGYKWVMLTPDAGNGLRALTAAMTIAKKRRVTTSDLVIALVRLGHARQDELLANLDPAVN